MADHRWTSTSGNLASAQSYSSGSVPVATDTVNFDGSSDMDVLTGLTAFTGLSMGRFWTTPEYDGNIGASGNPLTSRISRLIHQGSGELWYARESAGGDYIVIDSPNQSGAFHLVSGAGANLFLGCLNGATFISNNVIFGNLYVSSKRAIGFPVVNIGTGVTAVNYVQNGGNVDTKSAIGSTHCSLDGGVLTCNALCTDTWTGLVNVDGGTFIYNGSGTLATVIVSSGTLDMSQDSRAKSIAVLVLFPGAQYITHKNITETLLIDLRGEVPILPA